MTIVPLTVGKLYDRAVLHGGDRIAITQGARNMTYRDLGDSAARLISALLARGLGKGDRIAFLMANCPEYVACEFALARIGATRVPLAVLLGADDHVYMMNFSRCRALIYHVKLLPRVLEMRERLAGVEQFICVSEDPALVPPGHLHLQALIAGHPPTPPGQDAETIDPEDIAGIYFTGGTTGRPKGVMLSHRAWFHTYYVEALEYGLGHREAFIFCSPLTHASGCLILPVLLRQGRCIVLERFDPSQLLAAIERERATATLLVPTMIYALLDHPDTERRDVGSLRTILYGASAIAPERLRQAVDRFGPIFAQFFGQTEAPMALTALAREDHVHPDPTRRLELLSSAGRATYPTELRLVDEDGAEVPPGQPGEVLARSPNMMSGYLDDPAATASAMGDGWLHTGDVARMDASGYITIVDRKKDMIISGGFNVYPREVEDTLFEHPAIRQAAVFGVPHERWGEEVRALVVLHAGAQTTEADLIEFVRGRRGTVMAPKVIEIVEAIPLTNLGKVDKKAIRARHWAGRARNV